jgi:hypothetical protein
MRSEGKQIAGIVFSTILFMAVLLWVLVAVEHIKCDNEWNDSGFQSDYKVFQGCKIKLKDGRWIPAKNYREL